MIDRLFKKDLYPFVLLLVCTAAYGILSPFLGFYWDDFPYMWFSRVGGPLGALRAIALDRPILGIFYAFPLSILGESPLTWQIFAILSRWLFSLSVFSFLSALFPKQRTENKLITLLFAVFPGFTQQYISVIYSHAFLIFTLYFYSLVLFVRAVKEQKFFWVGLVSTLLALICMAATEYLVGLEALRPFIIYLVISSESPDSNSKSLIRQMLRLWWPYLIAGLGFVFYRIFLASSVLYDVQQVDNIAQSPVATLFQLFRVTVSNVYTALIAAWIQIIEPLVNFEFQSLASKLYLLVLSFSFLLSAAGCYYLLKKNPLNINKNYVFALVLGGFLTLVFAGIPFWAANFQLDTRFPSDRFFLPFMLASSVMIFLPLLLLRNVRIIFSLLFAVIFSFSLSFQVNYANNYRNEWDRFKDFLTQITWRIPSLEEDTLLVTDELTLRYYSDNSLTAAFNWVYADPQQEKTLPYLINFSKARMGRSLPSLSPGTKVNHGYRTHQFKGSTDQMILFYHLPPGCFHIADPDLDPYNPLIDSSIRPAAALSKPDLIKTQLDQNPAFFINPEKPQTWCYFYQKASLAAQNQEWPTVVELAQTAFSLNDYPNDASERIPYIEAFAMTADWDQAYELTNVTLQVSPLYQPMLCQLWLRIDAQADASMEKNEALEKIDNLLQCDF
jgi:hypothetical protein